MIVDASVTASRWFRGDADPLAGILLFCLPYAGAGIGAYRQWPALLAPDVSVQAVMLPGRGLRIREDPRPDPIALAAAITERADRPFAIFGHSMGARLGFEVTRELRRKGAPMPMMLLVSAARPPHAPLESRYSDLPDDEFLAAVAALDGMLPELTENAELKELALAVLRADFGWLEDYQPADEEPLPVPIVAFAADRDPIAPAEIMAGWAQHTSAGWRQHALPGGHFFLGEDLVIAADRVRAELAPPHRFSFGTRGWQMWREALLRTAGFPAGALEDLSAPDAAKQADSYLTGQATAEEFGQVFAAAIADNSRLAYEVSLNPLVREAVTWQNPGAMVALDALARGGPVAVRNQRRRGREHLVARYWQRYCAKNETVGFFGPICWISVDPQSPAGAVQPGPGLTRERHVFLEHWAVQALAGRLVEDTALRACLPPMLRSHLVLDGRTVRHHARPPIQLSLPQLIAVQLCDGERPAAQIAAVMLADSASGLRHEDDVYLLLDRLAQQGVLTWDFDLPMRHTAEQILREKLAAIGLPAASALASLDEITEARLAVQRCAGKPEELRIALAELDSRFIAVAGGLARRRSGQAYAGRTLCYEETTRDLDVVVGRAVVAALAAPLEVLLQASRWLTSAVAQAYAEPLRELYLDLAGDPRASSVSLGQLWFLAQGLFFGTQRPADAVSAEFVARWATLFGLDGVLPGTQEIKFTAEELAAAVENAFPAHRPGWNLGRLHSPDLHLCAPSAEALAAGDFTAVLGEMHAAWASFDTAAFLIGHPDPQRLRDSLKADLGPGRIVPHYPISWPRTTGRVTRGLDNDTDWELCFDDAPGANRLRHLPIGGLTVSEVDGCLLASTPQGRSWPLLEVLGELLSLQAVDAFKLVAAAEHTPRITIDRLVVARESWQTTVEATGLAEAVGDANRFLAVRRWRQRLDLPERVFVKLATETKPFYIDLTSPIYASVLCSAMRAASKSGAGQARVVVTEMLPTPDQAWVPDAQGRRYFSELRLQILDPAGPR
jgi:surfactin synthase thioesterase subunit